MEVCVTLVIWGWKWLCNGNGSCPTWWVSVIETPLKHGDSMLAE